MLPILSDLFYCLPFHFNFAFIHEGKIDGKVDVFRGFLQFSPLICDKAARLAFLDSTLSPSSVDNPGPFELNSANKFNLTPTVWAKNQLNIEL